MTGTIRELLPRGKALIALVVLAAGLALFIVALSRRDDTKKECASQTFDGAVDTDRTDDDTLNLFVAQHEDGPIPLTGWVKTARTGDTSIYSSAEQGHWQIVIRKGAVRSYSGCP